MRAVVGICLIYVSPNQITIISTAYKFTFTVINVRADQHTRNALFTE